MNLRSCKYTAAQGTAPAAPLRYNSSLYYLFCAKRSSFFQQNVHRRSKTAPNAFFFGQFAACPGAVLTNPAALCYNFHDFRQEAGPAGRSPPYTIFSRRIFETDAMKGSAVGLQADWQAPFFVFLRRSHRRKQMKTKNSSPARNVVLAALFLALAFVLPMVTGHLPQVGNMLCPMHFPILLCGFVLGGPWGLAVGFAAPLLRSVLFGMPPMFPIAISMAFELAAYGAVSGWLYRRVKHTLPMTYATLAAAMVAGARSASCWRACPARASRSRPSCPVRSSPLCRASSHSWCSSPSSSPLCRKPRCWSNRFSLPLSQVKKLVQHPNNIFSICNSTLLLLH